MSPINFINPEIVFTVPKVFTAKWNN